MEEKKIESGLNYYEDALAMFVDERYDISSITQTKKLMAMAYLETKKYDVAITILEDALTELSQPGMERKFYQLMKAEVWNCMSKVYQRRGDHSSAKNFAKLGKPELFYDCVWYNMILLLTCCESSPSPQLYKHTSLNLAKGIL